MRQCPFLFKQIDINRQSRQRILRNESEIRMNWSEHSEHAGFLHPVQLHPEIALCEHSVQVELWFEFFRRRKQRELNALGPKRMHRQRVQRQLDTPAFHQLSSEFSL